MENKTNSHEKWQKYSQDFFEKYSVYTDLALEAHEVISEQEGPLEIPGVVVESNEHEHATVSRVTVENEIGAKTIGKAPGHYSTIESQVLRQHNREIQEQIGGLLGKEVQWFLEQTNVGEEAPVLVVGLGNWNATPDALGPRVTENLMVTRHLLEMSPPELKGGMRPVAAVAPGVLGLTGIETGEIIMGVASRIGAQAVICIDALASRSIERLCSTVQISDTGINPGAGVGNKRLPINQETLGIPVISIGVPTVVHAATIVSDAMQMLGGQQPGPNQQEVPQATQINPDPNMIMSGEENRQTQSASQPQMSSAQRMQMISQLLEPFMGSMIVTPKEIDALIDDVTQVVAGGLNTAFHEGIDYSEVFQYLS